MRFRFVWWWWWLRVSRELVAMGSLRQFNVEIFYSTLSSQPAWTNLLSFQLTGKKVRRVIHCSLGWSLPTLPVSTSAGFPSWIISLHSWSFTLPVSSGAGAGAGGGGGGVSSNDRRDKSLSVWRPGERRRSWLLTGAAKYWLLALRFRLHFYKVTKTFYCPEKLKLWCEQTCLVC